MKKELTPEEETNKRKKAIGGVIGLCVAMLFSGLAMKNNYLSDKGLLKEIEAGNKGCPVFIEDFVRIDSFSMPASKTFMQHATALGMVKEEANLDTIRKYIQPGLLENTKNNPQLKAARNSKITFIYSFNDENGDIFYEYTVTPEMYK